MKQIIFLSSVILMVSFLWSCKDKEEEIPADCSKVHWNHDEQKEWVNLCTGYNACSGKNQSPINITETVANPNLPSLVFEYSETPTEIENKVYTIEFVCEEGNKLVIGEREYKLIQFHYHAKSEHQINGTNYPLEVHFVHKSSDTDFAVVGVFFEEGEENPLFAKYLAHFPAAEDKYIDTAKIFLEKLLPENKSFYHYSGSLTTPPCSEVVNWYVLKNKITASSAQIAQMQSILNDNYLSTQEINGRIVYTKDE